MTKPSKQDMENGKTLAARVAFTFKALSEKPLASEEEWARIYQWLQEYQLMGLVLILLEMVEENG